MTTSVASSTVQEPLWAEARPRWGRHGLSGLALVHGVPIGTLAGIHARARIVVGMDSGALHLAALLGTPVVALFGAVRSRALRPARSGDRVRALWQALPCSPCGTLEAPPCGATREPQCLLATSDQEVIRAAVALITDPRRPHRAVAGGDSRRAAAMRS